MLSPKRAAAMKAGGGRWPGATWYEAGEQGAGWPPLKGRQSCRVAIIGGGLAGISTALGLIERGLDSVAVLDSHGPGAGASGRNGGFVFAGYSLGNDALIDQLGEDDARRLHGYTRAGVRLVRERIDRYAIDCQVNDAGVVLADWFGEPETLQAAAERMRRRLGFEQEWISPRRMSDWVDSPRYGGGLLEPGSFHFNPLEHIRGLAGQVEAAGGRVFGSSAVRSITRRGGHWRLETGEARVEAEQVVLATGGYDRRLLRSIQRALQPVATYIVVTEPLGERLHRRLPRPVAVYDTRFAFDYYRP
ncbi:MAG TPA: FAD-dependent oxidoreductase, partial [Wenzhouxiangella sp.]|nr:FAD-dependent oxidoreductase [Wenzhouxiangella sp.]